MAALDNYCPKCGYPRTPRPDDDTAMEGYCLCEGTMLECECRHEDCGAIFESHTTSQEATCCPECGRQQMPLPTVKRDSPPEKVRAYLEANGWRKHPTMGGGLTSYYADPRDPGTYHPLDDAHQWQMERDGLKWDDDNDIQ